MNLNENSIIEGKILKRYKRFFCDIELPDGEIVVAHCPNTGSMKTCWEPGEGAIVHHNPSPKRKLDYTLLYTFQNQSWVGVHTGKTNDLVADSLAKQEIPELTWVKEIKREKKVGDSRIDFYLEDSKNDGQENPKRKAFLEVKNVTYRTETGEATFPDSVSTRGQKHLLELKDLVRPSEHLEAYLLFVVQRSDVDRFQIENQFDPKYAELLVDAINNGVQVLVYQWNLEIDPSNGERRNFLSRKLPLFYQAKSMGA